MGLNEIKSFLRIDGEDSDAELQLMYEAAKEYVTNGVGECDESKARVKLVLLNIIATMYENRLFTVDSANEKVRYAISSMMLQLSLECESENDSTSGEDNIS